MKTMREFHIVLVTVAAITATGWAFVHPPRDILSQSDTVLEIEFQSLDTNTGIAVAKVVEVLMAAPNRADANKPVPKEIKIDFLAMGPALGEQGRRAMGLVQSGFKQAVLFTGKIELRGDDQDKLDDDLPPPRAFLNIGGRWMILNQDPNSGVWEMEKMWEFLLGYWAGSTDMFVKCVKHMVADPGWDPPVTEGVQWDAYSIARIGKVPGKVFSAIPVDLTGKGPADLFVAADSGDRVFRWDGNTLVDVSAKLGVTSKSTVAAWGDFNGDGKLALASWDGKALSVFSQKEVGTFTERLCNLGNALKDGCLSLSTIDAGVKGKAGLIVGTKTGPVLLVPQGDGAFQAKPLGAGARDPNRGAPGACLVADLDGDNIPDVLQIFAGGSLFYKGATPGAFVAPARSAINAGPGRWGACLGDFDGDGLQDVFITGEDRNSLWQNLGGGKFIDMLSYCGELPYISKNGGIGAWSGDFNNDGSQDLMMFYGTNKMAPQLFFNRGFRCFGLARDELDIAQHKASLEDLDPALASQAATGQQAACLGDFDGDGALDMVLVLTGRAEMAKQGWDKRGPPIAAGATIYWDANTRLVTDSNEGDRPALGKAEAAADANTPYVSVRLESENVVFFPRRVNIESGNDNCVVASLPLSAPSQGPLNVLAYEDKRLMGAWTLRAGEPGAIIGARRPGPITLKWTWPDGRQQEKRVVVRDGPVRVVLDGK